MAKQALLGVTSGSQKTCRCMTDSHMRLLAWFAEHEGASLATAADALGVPLVEVERLVMEFVDAGMVERTALH